MTICVFGLWHLGCVIASSLADTGFKVIGLDPEKETIENLNNGKPPIFEPGLAELIKKGMTNNNLSFTNAPGPALKNSDVLWIAFDTPVDEDDNADTAFVERSILSVIDHIKDGTLIITSSQVPVGFTAKMEKMFKDKGKSVKLAYSPENLRLGKALQVFRNPDRIIIGLRNKNDINEFFAVFSKITNRLEFMKTESAEMTKHAINSFLAASVVFANEIASLCESVGADAKEVERGLKTEERIGPKAYLGPGLAYSGGTLARDINFLIQLGKESGGNPILLKSIKESNDYHKGWLKRKCLDIYKDLHNIRFTVLGLTYKPDTDTLRRSSSVEFCQWLNDQGAKVTAYDPIVAAIPENLKKIIKLDDLDSAIRTAECVVIATQHSQFQKINEKIKELLKGKVLIDPTAFLDKTIENKDEIKYITIGRVNL